ncbi:oxoglutarate-dependent flavonoid 7-O-demethylase 1-like [Apium graveolens]|uniref:oxoglutarate-dependent flavonoid 7-O-demethylase 1-like n=1 Tax=Apium graveolens TaxID=4045 RepID=UPI003D7BC346
MEILWKVSLTNYTFACKEWGFFQLINHGVCNSLIEEFKKEIDEFFKLPLEEKQKFGQLKGDIQGYGQMFVVSDEQKLDWADMLYLITLPENLRKPHILPKFPPSLRNVVEAYSAELKKLAMKLLNIMARALEIKPEEIETLFEEGLQSMRMNYYPPCPQPDQVIGLSSHSDGDGLTFILELNDTQGLQVRKDGTWVNVKPLPSAFVANIGDVMEVLSNGTYPSIEHRGVVNSVKARMSLATFLSPSIHGEFGPAPSLLSSGTPPKFRRIGSLDYLKGAFAQKELAGKSFINTLRI